MQQRGQVGGRHMAFRRIQQPRGQAQQRTPLR